LKSSAIPGRWCIATATGLAAIFVIGGAYALYGLPTQFDTRAVIFSFRLQFLRGDFAS